MANVLGLGSVIVSCYVFYNLFPFLLHNAAEFVLPVLYSTLEISIQTFPSVDYHAIWKGEEGYEKLAILFALFSNSRFPIPAIHCWEPTLLENFVPQFSNLMNSVTFWIFWFCYPGLCKMVFSLIIITSSGDDFSTSGLLSTLAVVYFFLGLRKAVTDFKNIWKRSRDYFYFIIHQGIINNNGGSEDEEEEEQEDVKALFRSNLSYLAREVGPILAIIRSEIFVFNVLVSTWYTIVFYGMCMTYWACFSAFFYYMVKERSIAKGYKKMEVKIGVGNGRNADELPNAIGTLFQRIEYAFCGVKKREFPLPPSLEFELSDKQFQMMPPHFECPLCLGLLNTPVIPTKCGKSYCKDCVIETTNNTAKDPYGDAVIDPNYIYPNRVLHQMILEWMKTNNIPYAVKKSQCGVPPIELKEEEEKKTK